MSSSITINSNLASLQTQRQLLQNAQGLQRTSERLSSGLRIVHAADDAAGLAIAASLNNDTRVYAQALRNLNDGISFLNIADGALDQLKTIVIRCRELATQAANGTMTAAQRSALDQEAQALAKEYDRIISTTQFNAASVFDAANANSNIQIGYGDSEAISLNTGNGTATLDTRRVSTSSSEGQGNLGTNSSAASLSGDGRYMLFNSAANNLVAGDSNGQYDLFLKDTQTGETQRINTSSAGAQATGGTASGYGILSVDGRYAIFASDGTNLVGGDSNTKFDVFLKDLQTGSIQRVSTTSSGAQATGGDSYTGGMTADSRYIVFHSDATNLVSGDTNGATDVFVKDMLTGSVQRVSTDSAGAQSSGGSSNQSSISADGRYVTFQSNATNLVAGDTNGTQDIFVKDLLTGVTQRVNTDSSGTVQTTVTSSNPVISADGRYVAFETSSSNLVAGDTNGQADIFVKDLLTGVTQRVNTSASGAQGTGGLASRAAVSADGRYVAFDSSQSNLVEGDTNGWADVFIKDMQTGGIKRASVSPDGTQAAIWSQFAAISADGRVVTFNSNSPVFVSGDTNSAQDIFCANNIAMSSSYGFSASIRALGGFTLKERTMAQLAQSTFDTYLDELNMAAGFVGSSLNRFSVASSTLTVRTENFAAAASRITDVDVAEDSADLTRRTILQQAASAILSQANQQPALALSLLQR